MDLVIFVQLILSHLHSAGKSCDIFFICIVTVRFNTTLVRDDESAGSLTFILVTNRPADESFTVQVCTEDVDLGPDLGMATGNHLYKMCL